jgi:hypothetical protein
VNRASRTKNVQQLIVYAGKGLLSSTRLASPLFPFMFLATVGVGCYSILCSVLVMPIVNRTVGCDSLVVVRWIICS